MLPDKIYLVKLPAWKCALMLNCHEGWAYTRFIAVRVSAASVRPTCAIVKNAMEQSIWDMLHL